jgi:hypothetical protein
MKKPLTKQKLVLSKETVRELGLVQGGIPASDNCYLSAATCPAF